MKFFNYSQIFEDKIKVVLTQVDPYWDSDYPSSRINKIESYFKLKKRRIISPYQIHSDNIAILSEQSTLNPKCDAIIYNSFSKIVGTINVADCIPICIYDFKNKNIALVHSGWKGTYKKIVLKTIDNMEKLGSNKNNLKIFLGPSIKGCCYEVTEEFSTQFNSSSILKLGGKYFVDLSNQVKFDLESILIPPENIVLDSSCTYESSNCHSFRRDGIGAGRMTMIAYRDIK